MASASTAPRMSSLTPAMAPASQPINYTTTTSQMGPVSTTHYQANSTASAYGNTAYQTNPPTVTYPMSSGGNTYPATGNVTTYPATGNITTTYPGTNGNFTTHPATTGNITTYPANTGNVTTYPATTGNITTYPGTGVTTYPATGGMSTSPTPGGITTYPATSPTHHGGATTYPMTNTTGTTTTTTHYPGQLAGATSKYPTASNTYPSTGINSTPVTTYPGTHQISTLPAYTGSAHSHQVYHPENTEYVMPPRSLRGGMRPLYDMHQVRTYEAAPVFHSAPYVVDGGETHLTREVHESSIHKSTSMVSDDAAHKKKHSSKNTQGKKKFCC